MDSDQNINEVLLPENVLSAVYSDANRNRVIWTPTILLRCLHIAYYPNIPDSLHKKANRALKTLWQDGKLIRRTDLRRDHRIPEAAYMRPEDRPGMYFVACAECGFPRFVRRDAIESCRKCAGENIDANKYHPVLTDSWIG